MKLSSRIAAAALTGILVSGAAAQAQDRRLLETGHAKGKVIGLETALKGIEGLDVPLHPGAEKFYREAGLIN